LLIQGKNHFTQSELNFRSKGLIHSHANYQLYSLIEFKDCAIPHLQTIVIKKSLVRKVEIPL